MSEKKRNEKPLLTLEDRAVMLGSDPFKATYDLVYGMVEAVYTQAGGVNNELIGIDLEAGKPIGVNVTVIKRANDVSRLRDEMLEKWPLVAHVCEMWADPDASVPPHEHPDRQDIVGITLHTLDCVAIASCPTNEAEKTVERGELLMPIEMSGRFGRKIPPRPLSS